MEVAIAGTLYSSIPTVEIVITGTVYIGGTMYTSVPTV